MSRAFVLGNGVSRLQVNLHVLRELGEIYGCNALYREFAPTVLVSTDRPISSRIQEEGYSLKHTMYTRRPIPGMGANRIPQEWYGFSSGPVATALAAMNHNQSIYLIGFDMGPAGPDRFNNVYADTEFYKKSSAKPTFTGNWVRQILQITKTFPNQNFFRVHGDTTATIPEFQKVPNLVAMTMEDFQNRINNTKDL